MHSLSNSFVDVLNSWRTLKIFSLTILPVLIKATKNALCATKATSNPNSANKLPRHY